FRGVQARRAAPAAERSVRPCDRGGTTPLKLAGVRGEYSLVRRRPQPPRPRPIGHLPSKGPAVRHVSLLVVGAVCLAAGAQPPEPPPGPHSAISDGPDLGRP